MWEHSADDDSSQKNDFLFKISGHQVFFSLVLSTIRTTSSYKDRKYAVSGLIFICILVFPE